jgi:DNA-binding NarL/FixJ family response regulator
MKTSTTLKTQTTKKARADFVSKFGAETYEVIKMFEKGQNNKEIYTDTSLPITTIAAYRAHYTRGTYDEYLGTLNFKR